VHPNPPLPPWLSDVKAGNRARRRRLLVKITILLVVTAVLMVMVACGEDNVLDEGEAVRLDYDDPDTYTTTICSAYTKYGCAAWTPIVNNDPAAWYVVIKAPHPDKPGEQRTELHEISQGFYDEVELGQWINVETEEVVPR
jgi:hypothetical protein